MTEPILNIRRVPPGVHEVHGDRVTKYVRMPPVCRQFRSFRVLPEDLVDRGRRHRVPIALACGEEIRVRVAAASFQVLPEKSPGCRMDRVLARDTALQARDPDALTDVLATDERRFLPAKAVAVDHVEKQLVPSVHRWNDGEEPFDFLFGEVGKLARGLAPDDMHSVSLSYVGRDLDVFTHFRELSPLLPLYRCYSFCKQSVALRIFGVLAVCLATLSSESQLPTACGTGDEVSARSTVLAAWANRRRSVSPDNVAASILATNGIAVIDADTTTAPFLRIFDLADTSLTFTPQSPDTYIVTKEPVVSDPDRGTRLLLSGDPASAVYDLPFSFPLFDRTLKTIYISRFNAIHGAPPRDPGFRQYDALELLSQRTPLISPLFMTRRTLPEVPQVFVRSTPDAVTVSWGTAAYDVRLTLFANGQIRFSYVRISRLAAAPHSSAVVITSGGEPWRSSLAALGETADPRGDYDPELPASFVPMADIIHARISRVASLDLLRLELTTAVAPDWSLLGPGAEIWIRLTLSAGTRIEFIDLDLSEDGIGLQLLRPIGLLRTASTDAARIDGATVTVDVLEENLGFRPTEAEFTTYFVTDNQGRPADHAQFAVQAPAPPTTAITDFSAVPQAGFQRSVLVEAFIRPTVNLDGVWSSLHSAFGWKAEDVDAVAVYETFRTDLDFFAGAYALPGNPGVDGIGFVNGGSYPRRPTLMQMNVAAHVPGSAEHERTLLHEFGHRWLFFVSYRDGLVNRTDLNPDNFHPAQWFDTRAAFNVETGYDCSTMGGAVFTPSGEGSFAIAPRGAYAYSWLDLYLMGLAGKHEVAPLFWLEHTEPPLGPAYWPSPSITSVRGTKRDVTVDQIIASEGPRRPEYPATQRQFKVAFVLLREPGNVAIDAALASVAWSRETMVRDFRAATGGRGEIVPLNAHKASRHRAVRH